MHNVNVMDIQYVREKAFKIELRVFEEVISFLNGASKVAQSPSL